MRHLLAKTSIVLLLSGTFVALSWANSENSNKHIVDEAWQVIDRKFVGDNYNTQSWQQTQREFLSKNYSSKEAAYEAIRAMLMKLNDPETRLLNSQQFASVEMEANGQSMGVGLIDFSVEMDEETKKLRVVSAIAGTPAARAGLQPKDIIRAIDGVATNRLNYDEAMMRMRGRAGTQVVLTIRRNGRTFDVPLKRKAIIVRPVRTSIEQEQGKTIGYIALSQFTPNAPQEMRQAVQQLLDEDVDGFILDLRNNPGGLIKASTEIGSIFLDKERIAMIVGKGGSLEFMTSGSRLTKKPMVVLVNGGTASASEVLAAALKGNHRAVLVGTTTYGRWLTHTGEKLSDGSVVIVTDGRISPLASDGTQGKGIKPDYVVEIPEKVLETWTSANIATPKDLQYTQAKAVLVQRLVQTE